MSFFKNSKQESIYYAGPIKIRNEPFTQNIPLQNAIIQNQNLSKGKVFGVLRNEKAILQEYEQAPSQN